MNFNSHTESSSESFSNYFQKCKNNEKLFLSDTTLLSRLPPQHMQHINFSPGAKKCAFRLHREHGSLDRDFGILPPSPSFIWSFSLSKIKVARWSPADKTLSCVCLCAAVHVHLNLLIRINARHFFLALFGVKFSSFATIIKICARGM